MKIEVKQFQIVKITDNKGNIIEAEKLIDINPSYWNDYCAVESLLHQQKKRYDYEEGRYVKYYPYQKRFWDMYCGISFIIDLDKDINILKTINTNKEVT